MPTTDAEVLAILTRPFDPKQIKQKPGQGGKRLSFISHGLVTERLNEADPFWESVTQHIHEFIDPATGRRHCEGVTLQLTIHFPEHGAVTRTESGGPQRQESFTNEIKNAQSDALKRCAMRFGVALSMWEKLVDAADDDDYQISPQARGTVNGQEMGPEVAQTWTDRSGAERVRVVSDSIKPEQAKAIQNLAARIDDPDWFNTLIGKHHAMTVGELHYRDAVAVIKAMSDRLSKAPAVQHG